MAVPEADTDIVLTIGAVAQRLGVAVPTLRSWDRRYGLGASVHEPGKHRRYNSQDIARLWQMVTLTGEGVPPASAARIVLGGSDPPAPARDGGGSGAQAVGRADRAVRGLARACLRFDVAQVHGLVDKHIRERGVLRTWEEVLAPLLRGFGERFQRGDDIVAVEHAATVGILRALHAVALAAPAQQWRLPALLGCAPEEQHSLPLEALTAALSECDCPSRFLGDRLTAKALRGAVQRLRPRAVVIWAHTARRARQVPLKSLARHGSVLLLVGPGWTDVHAAAEYRRPTSLTEARHMILEITGVPA